MTDLADQMLADWSYYRLQTKHMHTLRAKGARIGPKKMTPKIRELLEDLVVWCRDRRMEPRLWLFSLFKGRGWVGSPQLLRGHLMSEKQVWRYQKMSGIGFFRQRRRATAAAHAADTEFDPNRDLSHAVEALKKQLLSSGQVQACLDKTLEQTMGFHPASRICAVCPLRGQCSIHLQSFVRFDIMSLRLGKMTSAAAEFEQRRDRG